MRVTIIDNEYTKGNGFEDDKLYLVKETNTCLTSSCNDVEICKRIFYTIGPHSVCSIDCIIIEE